MTSRGLLYCLFVFLLLSGCHSREPGPINHLETIPDPKTLGETYVSDPDSVLATATVQALNRQLRAFDQAGRAHIDVVLVQSIGEAVPKMAATELFNRWKIGDKERDNGLLMLLVLDQHRIEFETGYGLEADLPDALCYRIQQHMLPYARAGNYDEAVRQGVAAIIRQLTGPTITGPAPTDSLALEPNSMAAAASPQSNSGAEHEIGANAGRELPNPVLLIFLGLGCAVGYGFLWYFTRSGRKHRWPLFLVLFGLPPALLLGLMAFTSWPVSYALLLGICYGAPWLYLHLYFLGVHKTFAADYHHQSRAAQYAYLAQAHHRLGFSAYAFPLLLAFYWRWHRRRLHGLRTAPYACPKCASAMRLLDEQADDAFLQPGQAAEESVASVDYDVWQCQQCQHTLVLSYQNLKSEAQPCTECHHLTALPQPDKIGRRATTAAAGWGWHIHRCAFCGHVAKEKYTLDRISTSSDSGSSSSSGSSSDSGSSSSSGGDSGGGGAGSSW